MNEYILINVKTSKAVPVTDGELDALYEALGDYQDYGDAEAELTHTIRAKISEVA
jgi:hypothetical protein